jgi:predicted GNAT family acetyltransferase
VTDNSDPVVADDPAHRRYTISRDGEQLGVAIYHDRRGRRIFVHTEIEPGHAGEGLGSSLVGGAIADAEERGIPVVPLCPFIERWLDRHPEHSDIVDDELTALLSDD